MSKNVRYSNLEIQHTRSVFNTTIEMPEGTDAFYALWQRYRDEFNNLPGGNINTSIEEYKQYLDRRNELRDILDQFQQEENRREDEAMRSPIMRQLARIHR
jgi:hypothetical protein